MALKQMEDAYNEASPLERAERWPKTEREKEYSRLRSRLKAETEKLRGHVSELVLEGEIHKTKAELAKLGITDF